MYAKRILFTLTFFMLGLLLHSHPHLFIKPSLEVVVNDDKIDGIKVIWEWDRWWSEEIIAECDLDKNGFLDEDEVQLVYQDYFSYIRDVNYFIELRIENRPHRVREVSDFHAKIIGDDIVVYEFMIPLNIDYRSGTRINVIFNDDTIYTAFDTTLRILPNEQDNAFYNVKTSRHRFYGVQTFFEVHDF